MTVEHFFNLCANHDWFACMSDDYGTVCKARKAEMRLAELAPNEAGRPEILAAFTEWRDASLRSGRALPMPQRGAFVPAIPSIPTVLHPQQTTIYQMGA